MPEPGTPRHETGTLEGVLRGADRRRRARVALEWIERADVQIDFENDQPLPVAQAANWPAFRGTELSGIADGQHPPAAFDLESGRNVKWRTPVEGLGLSSPIIWDGRSS